MSITDSPSTSGVRPESGKICGAYAHRTSNIRGCLLYTSLEESAQLDGAGYWTRFTKIIFPLSKPILATIAIFGAVGHWNSFQDSLILMQSKPELFTLQHKLYIYLNQASNLAATMQSGGTLSQGQVQNLMNIKVVKYTVAMVTVIPILLVYPFMQKYFDCLLYTSRCV